MTDSTHHTPRLLSDADAAADLAGVARPSLPSVSTALETALNRIEDMLSDDDGQAFKEARKFLPVGRAALAAQPGAVGLTDEQIKRHSLLAADCPGASTVILVSSLRRLLAAAPTEAKPAQQDAVDADWKVGPLTDELTLILGRPNFTCIHYAEMLRELGQEIPRKAEAEQAAVIHWMLGFYATHGDKWAEAAVESVNSRHAAISAKKVGAA